MNEPDLTAYEDVLAYMKQSSSHDDYDQRLEAVKAANGGNLPAFWSDVLIALLFYYTKDLYQ